MLEFIAFVFAVFGIPATLYICDLGNESDQRLFPAAIPIVILALLAWWWWGIWAPFIAFLLSIGAALGHRQNRKMIQNSQAARKPTEPSFSGQYEIWRGAQPAEGLSDAATLDGETGKAQKHSAVEFTSPNDDRKDANGEWKLSRREWISKIDNPAIPDAGRWARFEYVDSDGIITEREIRNWSKRGAYIEGFCMLRRASRNFRQDRISDWVSG